MVETHLLDEHMRYLGCLGLLAECSVYMTGPEADEMRAVIEEALGDAMKAGAISGYRRVANRFEVW